MHPRRRTPGAALAVLALLVGGSAIGPAAAVPLGTDRSSAPGPAPVALSPDDSVATSEAPASPRREAPSMVDTRAAAIRTAAGTSPRKGSIAPGRDLKRWSLTHNPGSGTMTAKATLWDVPRKAAEVVLQVYGGRVVPAGCQPTAVLVSFGHTGPGQWFNLVPEPTMGRASYSRRGATVTLQATAPALRGPRACAFARTTDNGEGVDQIIYDESLWTRMAPVPQPDLRIDPDLATHLSNPVGAWRRIPVKIDNVGDVPARRVRLTSRGSGLQVKPRVVKVPAIAAYADRTVRVRVRLTKRRAGTVRFSADAAAMSKPSTRAVTIHPKAKPLPSPRSPVGTTWWTNSVEPAFAWRNHGVTFVSKRFAYVGFSKNGVPRCRKVTPGNGPGCVRWSYNAGTGALRVGGQKGAYRKGDLRLAGLTYRRLQTPRKGWRIGVGLGHIGFRGCRPGEPCSTFRYDLTLRRNGTFRASTFVVHSRRPATGDAGTRASTDAGKTPLPEGRGRYAVGARGRIVFTYSSGAKVSRTLGIDTDGRDRPDPYEEGLLVTGYNYYP